MLVVNEENALVPLANFDLDCPLINAVFSLKGRHLRAWSILMLLKLRIHCFIIKGFKFLDRNVANRQHNDEGYLAQGLCLVNEKIWSF